MSPERVRAVVYRSIDTINGFLPHDEAIEVSDHLVLLGANAVLDSMGFVNFIVVLEEELEREFGRDLSLVDLLQVQSEDASVLTVADLIRKVVDGIV
jgi:acyl carrier protein